LKSYILPDYIQNACIEVSMDELKSMAMKGCWKKLWSEAVSDSQGFPKLAGQSKKHPCFDP